MTSVNHCRVLTLYVSSAFIMALFFTSTASADSGCSKSAFETVCASCNFSSSGSIDTACKDGYTATGKTCLMAAYPLMAVEYEGGNCPEVDDCIDTFNVCTVPGCMGTDKEDCSDPLCKTCYSQGDACLEDAAKLCTKRFYDENPLSELCFCFGYLPLLASAAAVLAKAVI